MTFKHRPHPLFVASALALIAISLFFFRGCSHKKLVEQFDNGPVRGPAGPSEGYYWVDVDASPTAGKGWKTVDPDSLTPAQRARIH